MFKQREEKWQKRWREARAFVPKNDGVLPRYYYLLEFPFLSGSGLHAGHMLTYTGIDVMARWKRRNGFDVLFPIGFDAMGITAEHYATKIGKHPADVVRELVPSYTDVIGKTGWSVNFESMFSTSDPEYVKWTQWMFIQFFKGGLAYKTEMPMNWCENCKTTLTNEELEGGKCERCKGVVEKRMKSGWTLAMSKYADRLIDDLELVDYQPEIKAAQINWIGRSYGADVNFAVGDDNMTIYTTRIDTIFGVTFMVLAPEHKLVAKWLDENKIKNADAVREYIKISKSKDEFERTDAGREKTGVKLDGISAINPYTGDEIPLFISDYVLANYGYGAVMAVPGHDERDFDFAKKFDLPIKYVIDENGNHINSEYLNGLNIQDATRVALEHGGDFARAAKQYKLKDWNFSRQMYWGEPIPMIYCEKCGWVPVPDDQLPVIQPFMTDYKPTETGDSPLAREADWVNTTCPKCGGCGRRETDTMPGWAGSSWYYMRYLDPHNDKQFCSREQLENWMPVNHYNGGHEHDTRHLLYSRFWHKALFDLGYVNTTEPYAKRTAQGLLMGSDGRKMSKSLNNGFMTADLINEVGADAGRTVVLSLGPWTSNTVYSEGALAGVVRFLKRVENLSDNLTDEKLNANQEFLVNDLVMKMTTRIESMQFNTAISAMMEFINAFGNTMPRAAYEILIRVLNPFAPHLTEEMWEKLGHKEMLVFNEWPKYDETKLVKKTATISVSVNGKLRATLEIPTDMEQEEIESSAKYMVEKYLIAEIIKVIYIPNKMINFVIKS